MTVANVIFDILHVVAAVFIVGPMAILPMTAMRAIRAGSPSQVRTLAKSTNIFSLLSLLVVILGFGAMGTADPKYHTSITDTWIWLAIVFYVIALALTLFVVVPAMRRAADAIEGEEAVEAEDPAAKAAPAAKSGGYGAIAGTSGIASLLLVAVVVLMVWKP
ncbi:DUF2269 family protein [Humibacter ginsenosidimutans]|uniref:DUF2269 family protein n=1 Tax=Humibacter ginsenosidimutans TaxID=2599293 RepID=A0A5B8M7H0_9MICO|nr:DUF2269 family protein [Humibacter ginsenosidimutans]QDZ16373.1 DUF2269 family protein [Humibacter ginsenosidimutans]